MTFLLRLTDDEKAALKAKALAEGTSMQAIAHDAVMAAVADRPARLRAITQAIMAEDAELLARLAK